MEERNNNLKKSQCNRFKLDMEKVKDIMVDIVDMANMDIMVIRVTTPTVMAPFSWLASWLSTSGI